MKKFEKEVEEESKPPAVRELNEPIFKKLEDFKSKNADYHLIEKNRQVEKIRYIFEVPEREDALKCYSFFKTHNINSNRDDYDFPLKEKM